MGRLDMKSDNTAYGKMRICTTTDGFGLAVANALLKRILKVSREGRDELCLFGKDLAHWRVVVLKAKYAISSLDFTGGIVMRSA
jgi:hypothetical protein